MERYVRITISGKVQGVGFRYSALKRAGSLGIRGSVRNMPDGSVYIEAAGRDQDIGKFLEWCHQGPPLARVDKVSIDEGYDNNYRGFVIK